MSRLPRLPGRKILTALQQAGFQVIRVRGSHHFLRHQDGRVTVVPIHTNEENWAWPAQQNTCGL